MQKGPRSPALAAEQKEGITWSAWIEINLDHLENNLQQIKNHSNAPVLPVLKNNAYGHGAPVIAAFLANKGCHLIAISSLEEALTIRHVTQIPLLLLTPPAEGQLPLLLQHNILPSVTKLTTLEKLNDLGAKHRKMVEFHLKVDTGFGRFGVDPREVPAIFELIKNTPYLKLGGVFTHFAVAFQDLKFTKKQLKTLTDLKRLAVQAGLTNICWHGANSAALLTLPPSQLDLVRVGTLLYGQSPVPLGEGWQLKETWQFKTRLSQIRTLPKGHSVGYGREYKTKRPTKVGVIPVGYGHGLELQPTGAVSVLYKQALNRLLRRDIPYVIYENSELPIIGRIGMGACCIDLSTKPHLTEGEELIIPMRRVTASSLLPRVYLQQGQIVCVFWENKFFFQGRWRSNLKGLFPTKFPLGRNS